MVAVYEVLKTRSLREYECLWISSARLIAIKIEIDLPLLVCGEITIEFIWLACRSESTYLVLKTILTVTSYLAGNL